MGMNECSSETVAMPPIVDASSAVHRRPPTPPPPFIASSTQPPAAAVRALGAEICEAGSGERKRMKRERQRSAEREASDQRFRTESGPGLAGGGTGLGSIVPRPHLLELHDATKRH